MRIRFDPFVAALLAFAALGIILPLTGSVFDYALALSEIAVMALFFLHGYRLPTREVMSGLGAWRVHAFIWGITFGLFPFMGWAFQTLAGDAVSAPIVTGIVYLTLVPSTVQTALALTSIAGGDRSISVVSASGSSMLGVFITPLLVSVLLSQNVSIDAGAILRIVGLLLAPFVVGQVARRFVRPRAASSDSRLISYDKLIIVFIVYIGFSSGTNANVWHAVSLPNLALIVGVCVLLFTVAALVAWFGSKPFGRPRQIAAFFAATNKSLMSGLPMALVLFPDASLGLMILPLMLFHQLQLIVGSTTAHRLSSLNEAGSN